MHLSPEEEKEFWTAVGGCEARARLKSVLSRMQHEDRLSLSSMGQVMDYFGHFSSDLFCFKKLKLISRRHTFL